MINREYIIGFLLILIPLILLYICSTSFKESYKNKIRGKNTQEKNWRNYRFFKPQNIREHNVPTNPVHSNGIPVQIETFKYDDNRWQNLRFFHPQGIDFGRKNPKLIPTNPIHKGITKKKEVIEHFLGNLKNKVNNIFSKPNSKIELDNVQVSQKKINPHALKGHKSNLNNLNKQFQSKLDNSSSNEALNKKLEKYALVNNKTGIPIINARPQTSLPNRLKKSDFQLKALKCQFFNDGCPSGYKSNGFFSIEGVNSGLTLSCGNSSGAKPAKAVAEIRDEQVHRIVITNPGHGYLSDMPPKVEITSRDGRGEGASADAIVDDDGRVKVIKVLNLGRNYTETPLINISHPSMNRSCHMCCKME